VAVPAAAGNHASSEASVRAVHFSQLEPFSRNWHWRPPRSMIIVAGENGLFPSSASSSVRG
jgi:hypothetical protein